MALRETIHLHSVAPDLIPADAPADNWNIGANVMFRNGETVAARDDRSVMASASINPKTITYVEPFDEGYWVYADESGVFANDGTTEFDITPASWGGHLTNAIFTSTVINGLAVINSSNRAPCWWDGLTGNICTPLPDWPVGGETLAIRSHKNFLFGIGFTSEGGQRVRWSTAAEAGTIPDSWTPLASNQAGFLDIAPMSSSCLDGLTMRDDMFIYKRESTWRMVFVGGSDIFALQKVFAEQGVAATNGVGRGPNDEHLLITSAGDIALSDGVQMRSVLSGRAQRTFYADFQGIQGDVFSVFTLNREKLGGVLYPKTGDAVGTSILIYDYDSGDISFRSAPDVLCAGTGRFLDDVGDANEWDGNLLAWNNNEDSWNQEINATTVEDVLFGTETGIMLFTGGLLSLPVNLEKSGLGFGDPQMRKQISRLWPKLEGVVGDVVQFRIGGQEISGGPTSLGPVLDYVIGQNEPLDMFVSGRYMTVIVESSDVGPWRLGSFDVEYTEQGAW